MQGCIHSIVTGLSLFFNLEEIKCLYYNYTSLVGGGVYTLNYKQREQRHFHNCIDSGEWAIFS